MNGYALLDDICSSLASKEASKSRMIALPIMVDRGIERRSGQYTIAPLIKASLQRLAADLS